MGNSSLEENLRSLGKLFDDYRRINPDKIKLGYPKELKNRLLFLLKNGVDKSEVLKVTKVSPATLSTWISQYNNADIIDLPSPKPLKIIADHPDLKVKTAIVEKIVDKYCAKININNGNTIELTEHGLLLSLNTLFGVK